MAMIVPGYEPACGDCGLMPGHAPDCYTLAVNEGRMTPRERQIARLERPQNSAALLRLAVDEASRSGGRVERVLMNQNEWAKLRRSLTLAEPALPVSAIEMLEDETCPTRATVFGYPVQVSDLVPDGQIIAHRAPSLWPQALRTPGAPPIEWDDAKITSVTAGGLVRSLATYAHTADNGDV